MRRLRHTGGLALVCLAFMLLARPVQALSIYLPPLPERMAVAKCVVLGKVTFIEKKTVMLQLYPTSPQKRECHVAVVKVEKAFTGAKGLTQLRVAYPVPRPRPAGQPMVAGLPSVKLAVGQEACFILQPNAKQAVYLLPWYYDLLNKKGNTQFAKQAAIIERSFKLLKDPAAGLKSKNAEDRLMTAGMLVARYRTPQPSPKKVRKTAPIDAEQSKLILSILMEAGWANKNTNPQLQIWPRMVFDKLGLTAKDGWKPSVQDRRDVKRYERTAKAWLKKNAGTYRIQQFVSK